MTKVIGLDLILNGPDSTGRVPTVAARLRQTVTNALLFEELSFDGFGVGERHHSPFLSSSPPVVLAHIAAVTERIRLFTGVTLLALLDPVRVAEDYATVDGLARGRLEMIIGKGNAAEQAALFGVDPADTWDALEENFLLLRRLWGEQAVSWQPREGIASIRRTPIIDAEVLPKPSQDAIRIWHGSATAERSVDLAARHAAPLFSANGFNPLDHYAKLIDRYREKWVEFGRDPDTAIVGAGHHLLITPRSQDAKRAYREFYEKLAPALATDYTRYEDYDDFLERGSALIGSPQEALDKLERY